MSEDGEQKKSLDELYDDALAEDRRRSASRSAVAPREASVTPASAAENEEPACNAWAIALERAEVAEKGLHQVATQVGEMAAERLRITAQCNFLLAHSTKLLDRLAGAKLEKGDFGFDGAAEFVNAERRAINAVMERIGGGA